MASLTSYSEAGICRTPARSCCLGIREDQKVTECDNEILTFSCGHVKASHCLYEETGFLLILLSLGHSSIVSFAKRLDGCHGQILIDWTGEGSLQTRDGSFRRINDADSLDTTANSERKLLKEKLRIPLKHIIRGFGACVFVKVSI